MTHKFSALDIATALGEKFPPNEQQQAAIEAPYDRPSLVVAGAGSGKTYLMSMRVPWLVANGIALPEQILGLTFTRKAAAELSNRINKNLRLLAKSTAVPGVWPAELGLEFTPPTISTYNSYATALFRDFGLQIGYDSDAIQLTEATAFQFARELINNHGHEIEPRLLDSDASSKSLITAAIEMAKAMTENLVTAADVEKYLQPIIEHVSQLPNTRSKGQYTGEVSGLLEKLSGNILVARLAQGFIDAKLNQGKIDFSDQVALAYRAVEHPDSGVIEREQQRFTQVLLDEYQDTSVLQTKLLSSLFYGKSVLAVGDPHQSIYGWRGASSANLAEYRADFGADSREPYQLSTSWRNPQVVLDIANQIAFPLDEPLDYVSAEHAELVRSVKRLPLRVRSGEANGRVEMQWHQTIEAEAKAVADWFADRIHVPIEENGKLRPPTGALLLAKKLYMPVYRDALQNAGIDVQIVGLGGLLTMPEVTDVRCALAVISSPSAGTQLIRLLTGARWRVGAKDIDGLYRYADWLAKNNTEFRDPDGNQADTKVSIVDALVHIGEDRLPHDDFISEEGLLRMIDAAKVFNNLRKRIGQPLAELVRTIVAELWIDIELLANPSRRNPLMHINEFISLVANYTTDSDSQAISGLLEYLDYADDLERVDAAPPITRPGMVQILTVHSSKGLEWDHVAVGSFNDGDLPKTIRDATGWMSLGKLPYALRGDVESLPKVDFFSCSNQTEVGRAVKDFKADGERPMLLQEQRRLAYVAVTRAKTNLLLTGSYWQPGDSAARKISKYLLECVEAGIEPMASYEPPELASQDGNPVTKASLVEHWPKPAFTEKRLSLVQQASDEVSKQLGSRAESQQVSKELEGLSGAIELLLAEQKNRKANATVVDFPVRISASNFKAYLDEYETMAGSFLRPVPSEPHSASRRGNLFHAWVERSNSPIGFNDPEDDFEELDDERDFYEVEQLQQNFLSSRFAKLTPLALEQEVQVTIGGNTFVCKMDAIYQTGDSYEIVDWKTNAPPKDEADWQRKSLQLSLYRWAYSKYSGVPLEKISAIFYFVGANEELQASRLLNEEEILELWQTVLDRVGQNA